MANTPRRLSIFNLVRATFHIYLQRPRFFIAASIAGPLLAAACPFIFWLVRTEVGTRQQAAPDWLPTIVATLVATTLMLLGMMFSSAVVVQSVADIEERAQKPSPQQRPKIRIWSVVAIVVSILTRMFATGVLLAIVGAGVLAVAAALGFNSRAVAGAIGFAVAAVWLLGVILSSIGIYARYAVAIQSCVLERIGRRAALKRSALLTTGNRNAIAVIYCAVMTLSCAIVLGEFMLLSRTHLIAICIVKALAALLAGALAAPFWTIGMALIYCDEREQASAMATH